MDPHYKVIGAGLAGSEAALVLARAGYTVHLYEQKPLRRSGAHKLDGAAELVCSNSLKSLELSSSSGLLKEELRLLGSPLLELAMKARVPGGKALSVDREKFSALVTEEIKRESRITFFTEAVDLIPDGSCLLASGPLTSEALAKEILALCGDQGLYFYDATSPIVSLDSLNLEKFFWSSRNEEGDDYLNLPLDKEEYRRFREAILSAEKFEAHSPDEDLKFFEGCLPLEVIAARGEETLACSCMRPQGFQNLPNDKRAYAVIQFRREKAAGELLSMVAFQTRMKWPEQERVFRTLPGMENAVFARLGAMHRNTFINSPAHLSDALSFRTRPNLFVAGQLSGSEGYSEALASGHYAALRMMGFPRLPETTAIQSLIRYVTESDPRFFQPMNFNFGLLPPIEFSKSEKRTAGLSQKMFVNQKRVSRALADLEVWKHQAAHGQLAALHHRVDFKTNFLRT